MVTILTPAPQVPAARQVPVLHRVPAAPATDRTGRVEAESWAFQMAVWFFTQPAAVRTIPPGVTTRMILILPPASRLTAAHQVRIQAPAAPHRAVPVQVLIAILPAQEATLTKMKASCWRSSTGPITRHRPVGLSTWEPDTLLFPGAVLRTGSRNGICISTSKAAVSE